MSTNAKDKIKIKDIKGLQAKNVNKAKDKIKIKDIKGLQAWGLSFCEKKSSQHFGSDRRSAEKLTRFMHINVGNFSQGYVCEQA